MIEIVKKILYSSINNLFENQPDILKNTSETTMTEWNLSHHLANEIAKYIFWLNYDLDLRKRNYKGKRPDIVFHKRGINEINFLVIELKKVNKNLNNDTEKIINRWMKKPLKYRFGASIFIKSAEEWEGILFENNNKKCEFKSKNESHTKIKVPSNKDIMKRMETLVDKIITAKKQNPQSDTTQLEREIDHLFYQLYDLTPDEIEIIKCRDE